MSLKNLVKVNLSECSSRVNTMKLCRLVHLVENEARLKHISPMNDTTYEQFNIHISTTPKSVSRRKAAHVA